MEKEEKKLSKHLDGKFEMLVYKPGKFLYKNDKGILVKLDTRTATVAEARAAIECGFKYLKDLKKDAAAAKVEAKK